MLSWAEADNSALAVAIDQYNRAPSALTVRDLVVLREYLARFIRQPAWDGPAFAALRETVGEARTHRSVYAWIQRATEAGLRPLDAPQVPDTRVHSRESLSEAPTGQDGDFTAR